MPLDSSIFNDPIEATDKHVCATMDLAEGDPSKYSMATADKAWATMVRVRMSDAAVTPERIIHDIDKLPRAFAAIVAAKGAYVPDCDLRSGRRKLMQSRNMKAKLEAGAAIALSEMAKGWKGLS